MAEPLKDRFGPDVPVRIATMIEAVHPGFPAADFITRALDGYDDLELTPRARQIARALAEHLPADPEQAITVLVESIGPPIEHVEGMESFIYLPHVYFVAEYGLPSSFVTACSAERPSNARDAGANELHASTRPSIAFGDDTVKRSSDTATTSFLRHHHARA